MSVVVDNFNERRSEFTGDKFMTPGQQKWVDMIKMTTYLKPRKHKPQPTNLLRLHAYWLVTRKAFKDFVQAIIVVNTI